MVLPAGLVDYHFAIQEVWRLDIERCQCIAQGLDHFVESGKHSLCTDGLKLHYFAALRTFLDHLARMSDFFHVADPGQPLAPQAGHRGRRHRFSPQSQSDILIAATKHYQKVLKRGSLDWSNSYSMATAC